MSKIFEDKRELVIELCIIVGVAAVIIISLLFMKNTPTYEDKTTTTPKEAEKVNYTETIAVVPTMDDELLSDSAWTPTFQLIWNDLKNKYVHQDIKWDGQPTMVDSLNKESFKENMISSDYLFKVADYKTLQLKEKIEKGIKEKFNQESDVLDDIDWSEPALDHGPQSDPRRILLYSMLYREFEYENPLDELNNSNFKDVANVRYFGIDEESESKLYSQIEVLHYDALSNDYIIKINTKNNDELYLVYKPKETTFNDIWKSVNEKIKNYNGNKKFTENDSLRIPYLKFFVKREYNELCDHDFYDLEGEHVYNIQKAIQTVKLELDNKGGKVKSEAVIDVKSTITSVDPKQPVHRYFIYNDTFALFIKEKGKDTPYFAARIDDINKYQDVKAE